MTETSSQIIPVIDERLGYQVNAPADHKIKVDKYNELLEDIYQREVELTKIKSELADMHKEITEEARLLDGTSHETPDAVKDEEEENDKELSDSGSDKGPKDKKAYKKKRKAHVRRSKIADSVLDAEWDYKLELIRGSVKKERRTSDAAEKEVEVVPLRAKAGLTTSH